MKKRIRLLKIYNNRRLYDFEVCSYVDHRHVRKLVCDGEPVRVINTRDQDVTLPVLTKALETSPKMQRANPGLLAQVTRLIRRAHA